MIKSTIAILLISLASIANAGPRYVYHHSHDGWWLAPLIGGGIITYEITKEPPPPVVLVTTSPPPPVVYVTQEPQPKVVPKPPEGYHYEQILDANCNCYRLVIVPNK